MQSEDKLAEFIAAANDLSGVAVEVTPDTPAAKKSFCSPLFISLIPKHKRP